MPSDKETDNFDLLEKRPAKYILMKPLTLRNDDKILNATDFPVEIGFLGLHGLPLEKSLQTRSHRAINPTNFLKVPSFKIKIEASNGNSWVDLLQINSACITDLSYGLKISRFIENSVFNNAPLGGSCVINISNEILESGFFNEIRVQILPNDLTDWILSGILLQTFVLKKEQKLGLSYESARILREKLFTSNFKDILKPISSNLIDPKLSFSERTRIARIIHLILSERPDFVNEIMKDLSLEQYLSLNIIPEIKDTSYDFLSLLKRLSILPDFKTQLSTALHSLLPKIADVPNITNRGIKTLFTLLHWSSPSQDTLTKALTEIINLSKKISSIRVPEYRILRTQYNIPLLSFERELFDENFILQITNDHSVQRLSSAE